MTKRQNLKPVPLLVCGLLLLALGICLVVRPQTGLDIILRIARTGLIVLTGMSLSTAVVSEHNRKPLAYLPTALYALGTICLFAFPQFFIASFWRLFGLWALLNAFLHAVSAINYRRDGADGWIRECIDGVITLLFAFAIIYNPLQHLIGLARLSGVYTIYCSTTFLGDFVASFFKTDVGRTITPKIYMPLPEFIAAFIPRQLLKTLNDVVESDPVRHDAPIPQQNPPLEVYIHMSDGVIEGFGHVDFSFMGKVYSYGCYDHTSHRLFGLVSDGTLAVCDVEPYMQHCLTYEKKTIIAFGIYLDDDGINKVRDNLQRMQDGLTAWPCAVERGDDAATDPASLLKRAADATYYKYNGGSFKTYFTLGTNCVKLAHHIIGNSGAGILHITGFITPGAYYAYLDKLYHLNGTIVTSKQVHTMA